MEFVHLSSVKYSVKRVEFYGWQRFCRNFGFEKGEEMEHERNHGKVADPVICF